MPPPTKIKYEKSYRIPFREDNSLRFFCYGATITKAILEINNIEIETVRVDCEPTQENLAPLEFFGGEPLHMMLAEGWQCAITIYTDFDDSRIPTLHMAIVHPTLTWDAPGLESGKYVLSDINVNSRTKGFIKMNFAYVKGKPGPSLSVADQAERFLLPE